MKWLKYGFMVLFHPIEIFYLVKRNRDEIPWLVSMILLFLASIMKIIYVYTVNYTVATKTPEDANALWELGTILVPVIAWVISSYALMTIMGGESTFKETLTITSYSLVPYIVGTPILILISQLLATSESGFHQAFQSIIVAWVVILVFVSFKESNGLTFGAAVWRAILSFVVMVLLAATLLLIFALGSQIVVFFQEITAEVNFYLR